MDRSGSLGLSCKTTESVLQFSPAVVQLPGIGFSEWRFRFKGPGQCNPLRRKDSAMQRDPLFFFPRLLLTVCCALCGGSAQAATPFAITATSLTMPSSNPPTTLSGGVTEIHLGTSQFSVTGIPGTGMLTLGCQYSGPTTEAKIPEQCGPVGAPGIPVIAGQTLTGNIEFVPYGQGPIPGLSQRHRVPRPSGKLPVTGIVLAGALMVGFGFRRRVRWGLAVAVFAVCASAGLAGLSACGGNISGMTPGTYPYTISAGFVETGSSAIQSVTTTVTLTVQ
jgi:hypothetical protein